MQKAVDRKPYVYARMCWQTYEYRCTKTNTAIMLCMRIQYSVYLCAYAIERTRLHAWGYGCTDTCAHAIAECDVQGKHTPRELDRAGGASRKQMYPLLFGVFGLKALGCLGF